MTVPQVLARLDELRRAPAAREGSGARGRLRVLASSGPPAVPAVALRALARRLGRRHRLALALWATGDSDARRLATLVDVPARVDDDQLDHWVQTAGDASLVDQVCLGLVLATPWARSKVGDWARHPQPLVRRAAYVLLRALARTDRGMTDADFVPWVDAVPSSAPREAPVVREAMVAALAAIGRRNAFLRERVAATSARLRRMAASAEGPSPLVLRASANDWLRAG